MEKALKIAAQVAIIAGGVLVGQMAYQWASPKISKLSASKPLDVSQA